MRTMFVGTCLATALLATGCGSSGSRSNSAGSSGSAGASDVRAAFIAKADSACKSVQGEQLAIRRQAKNQKTLAALVPSLRKQAAIAQRLAADLRAITPPPADRLPVSRFVDAVQGIGTYSTALANATAAGHASAAITLRNRLIQTHAQEMDLGKGYGFRVCGNGVGY